MACAVASGDVGNPGGIPFSDLGDEAFGSWIGVGLFTGHASPQDEQGSLLPPREVTVVGTCALTLAGGRLLGILDADDEVASLLNVSVKGQERLSVWFAAAKTEISVTTAGEQGLFGKRPKLVELRAAGWDFHLRQVYKLTRPCSPDLAFKHNSAQPRGENSLVAALGAPS